MREAVIVSTARTPIGRAYRGAFNDTQAQQLGAHAVKHAVQRAGVDPAEIEDVTRRGMTIAKDPDTYLDGQQLGGSSGTCTPLPPGAGWRQRLPQVGQASRTFR